MTNATKTLLIIFAVSFLLFLLQIAFSGTGESDIFRGDLLVFDSSQVDRIVVSHPADTSVSEIMMSNGAWEVRAENEVYQADSQKVKLALRELQNMEVESIVTRNPEKHSRYRVDDRSGTTITLFNGDQELDQIIASSSQFPGSSNEIYARIPGEEQVYSVSGLNRSSIQSNYNYWRDLTVWNIPPESITEIRFNYPADSSFTIKRENGRWISGTDALDEQKISTLSNMLARLQATGYPPDGTDESVSDPLYAIDFLMASGEKKRINFYRFIEAEPAPFYLVTASEYPYRFTLAKRTWDQGVLMSRDEYLKE